MEHPEVRFRIPYYLYNKYYGSQTEKRQPVENIIQETELKNINRNPINGNIAYLYSSSFVTGTRIIDDSGYPNSIIITNNGIDLVENIINEIILNLRNQQVSMIEKNKIELMLKSDERARTTRVWDHIKARGEHVANVGKKVPKLFLSAGY